MTKEDFEQLKSTVKQWLFHTGSLDPAKYANELKSKFIEPLENENTELKSELTKKADTNHSLVEQMADLESKNAELKEDLEIQKKTVVEMVMPALDRTIKQRTQAVELLNEAQGYIENEDDELYDKIEQLLQEIEK